MSNGNVQFITPPNTLRQKVGGKLEAFDQDAIRRAEEALAALSNQFEGWLNEEIDRLERARMAARASSWAESEFAEVYTVAHDLKGLGTTYEYPLVSRMAGSLCEICRTVEQREQGGVELGRLADAHVDAIKAAVRQKIKTDEHPVGNALAVELESRVRALAA